MAHGIAIGLLGKGLHRKKYEIYYLRQLRIQVSILVVVRRTYKIGVPRSCDAKYGK